MLFHVRFIADVPLDGRYAETCAIDVVPPVRVFERMLLRTSQPVDPVDTTHSPADRRLDVGVPVIHLDSSCHGSWAYRRLARELLIRLGDARGEDFPELREPAPDETRAETPVAESSGAATPVAETIEEPSLPVLVAPEGGWPITREPVGVGAGGDSTVAAEPAPPDGDSWGKW